MTNEIQCMCSGQCGSTFKVSEKEKERAVAFEDVLISRACPNTDLSDEFVIEKLDDFAIIATLEVSS